MAIYNVHGGHSLVCRGASSILDEVTEDRKVKNKVIELLKKEGHTVYDCTDDVGKTQQKNLSAIIGKCNKHSVAYDVSIHLNAGRNDKTGDNKTGGCEVINYDVRTKEVSDRICKNIAAALGITNRGTKYNKNFAVLNSTKSLAMIIECCFVDDKDDADKWDADKCAVAIVEGLLNKKISTTTSTNATTSSSTTKINVVHQAKPKGSKFQSEVTNWNSKNTCGYSGVLGKPIIAFRAKTKGTAKESGYLEYREHLLNSKWQDWRRDYNKDSSGTTYAGNDKTSIDGVQFRIVGVKNRHVKYRVHTLNGSWLPWVTDYGDGSDGYAGIIGTAIDAIQIEVV